MHLVVVHKTDYVFAMIKRLYSFQFLNFNNYYTTFIQFFHNGIQNYANYFNLDEKKSKFKSTRILDIKLTKTNLNCILVAKTTSVLSKYFRQRLIKLKQNYLDRMILKSRSRSLPCCNSSGLLILLHYNKVK